MTSSPRRTSASSRARRDGRRSGGRRSVEPRYHRPPHASALDELPRENVLLLVGVVPTPLKVELGALPAGLDVPRPGEGAGGLVVLVQGDEGGPPLRYPIPLGQLPLEGLQVPSLLDTPHDRALDPVVVLAGDGLD